MKQNLLNKLWLRVGMLVAIMTTALAGTVWAEEVVYYTLDGTQTGGDNGYATESSITQNNITWMVTGNTTMSPWRIGGKSLEGVNRKVYSTTVMGSAISKVELEVGSASSITVNSLKLIVASDASFATQIDEVSAEFAASSTITFTPTSGTEWSTGAYYKFVFNVTVSGTSNKFVEFKNAKFYYDNSGSNVKPIPTITVSSPVDNLGNAMSTLYVNENFYVTVTTTSDAAITYTSNESELYVRTWNTETGKMCLIPHVDGQVSITYSVAETANYAAAEKTETFTIVKTPTTCEIVVPDGFNNNIADGTTAGRLKGQIEGRTSYNSLSDNPTIASLFTWTSSDTDVATIASDGTVTLVAAGTTTITCNFAGDATYAASSKTYTLSVINGEYVQPTTIEANLNNSLFGTSYTGSVSGLTDENALSGTIDNVTITYGGNGNHYVNDSQIRFYPNNKLTIEAPEGYEIKSIVFTSAGTWAATISADNGSYDSSTKTWTGSESSVLFTGSGSSRCDMSKATITIGLLSTDPSISANDVSIAYDATGGSIDYTLENATGNVTATVTDGDWLTLGTITASAVPFTCAANTGAERTATVTLSFSGAADKVVTITQAAAPVVYTTIPALFDAATSTATEVNVTFNNWVVSGVSTNGKNVFVTDNNGNGFVIFSNNDQSSTYSAGSVLSGTAVSCTLKKYNGFAELLNVDASDLTITSGGTVTAANIAMADLAGVNTGALVSYDNLTCSVDESGSTPKYYLSDGTTTLQVYNSLYAFDALEAGKTYNITGIYQQYNSTKEILPRNAADIKEYEAPQHTVKFFINGVEQTEAEALVSEGDAITFPADPAEIEGKTFVGWTTTEISGTTDDEPAMVFSATMGTADVTYYAVFATKHSGSVTTVTDVLNREFTGVTGTSYADWSDKSATSSAVYAGESAGGNSSIQLRSQSPSGIVSTTSGGKAKKVIVSWNSNTAANRTIGVYGSTIPYTSASDLYAITSTSRQIGTIVKGTSTELEISGDYEYIGIRSEGNALYLNSITIEWQTMLDTYSGYCTTIPYEPESIALNTSGYATFASTSAVDFTNAEANGYSAWAVTAVSGTEITFSQITGAVEAGTGVLLKGEASATIEPVYVSSGEPVANNKLVGIITPTAIEADQYYGLSGSLFKKVKAGTVNAGKALLPASVVNGTEVKTLTFVFEEDDPTGVNDLNVDINLNSVIYNVSGQRLNKMQKGINIVNGKKVIK